MTADGGHLHLAVNMCWPYSYGHLHLAVNMCWPYAYLIRSFASGCQYVLAVRIHTFNLATLSRTLTLNDSTERFAMNGYLNITGRI